MRDTLRLFYQTAIILFVLWHSFAVAVYTVPRDAKDPLSKWIIADMIPKVTPYMLQTSQWQLWNLFAPDPQRRVTYYHVEMYDKDAWSTIEAIDANHYSIWRHATRFKMMGNLLDEFGENRKQAADRFMHLKCAEFNLPQGMPVRILYEYYLIPFHKQRAPLAWWQAWRPEPQRYTKFETLCP